MNGKAVWLHSNDGRATTFIDGESTRRGILCQSNETSETIIEGFTIHHCYTNSYGGGGMRCDSSHPTIMNCAFVNNVAIGHGGGLATYPGANPVLTDCTFIDNTSTGHGGGLISSGGSNPTITGCTFTGNTAASDSGSTQWRRYIQQRKRFAD